jgi:hypothetical protein
MGFKERFSYRKKLSARELAILARVERGSSHGVDFMEIMNACRPYIGKWKEKVFATRREILVSLSKLIKVGLVYNK